MGADVDDRDILRQRRLAAALAELAAAECEDDLVAALIGHARLLVGADGICIVRRESEEVRYIAEDAMAPLWAGRTFPIDACISGTAMLQNRPILIPDIRADRRMALPAYEATFVRSLAVLPIGKPRPRLAIGAYWSAPGPIPRQAVDMLSNLAQAATRAVEIVHGAEWPRARRFANG
jgi:GAF domain-containing protein